MNAQSKANHGFSTQQEGRIMGVPLEQCTIGQSVSQSVGQLFKIG